MRNVFLGFLVAAVSTAVSFFSPAGTVSASGDDFIKWVDFNPKYEIIQKAYELDVKSQNEEVKFGFVDTLAWLAYKNGNNFSAKTDLKNLESYKKQILSGKTVGELINEKNKKLYDYYRACYNAVFAEYIGFYSVDGGEPKYGLKAYHPLAKGYGYADADDFGNSRSYGFKRVHLGHDLFGSVGTPVAAVEGGTVTEYGWNRYGGWRIGIRSDDGLRYYYYAHLRKNKPYAAGLEKGSKIEAGQIIGYLGMTGYSTKENVNMNTKPHLHFGLQLIFDESQEDGNGEIWIDVYQLVRFLKQNRTETEKQEDGHHKSVRLRKSVDTPDEGIRP